MTNSNDFEGYIGRVFRPKNDPSIYFIVLRENKESEDWDYGDRLVEVRMLKSKGVTNLKKKFFFSGEYIPA